MTPQDLRNAAAKIEAAADKYVRLADRADAASNIALAALHSAVARQLRDRAAQLRLWAEQAERTGAVTPDMEAGAQEFLKYAGV